MRRRGHADTQSIPVEMVGWKLKVVSGVPGEECIDLYRGSPILTR